MEYFESPTDSDSLSSIDNPRSPTYSQLSLVQSYTMSDEADQPDRSYPERIARLEGEIHGRDQAYQAINQAYQAINQTNQEIQEIQENQAKLQQIDQCLRNITRAESFEHVINLVSRRSKDDICSHLLEKCKTISLISFYVFGRQEDVIAPVLDRLEVYLKTYHQNDGMKYKLIDLFLSIRITIVAARQGLAQGTDNICLKKYEFKYNDKFVGRANIHSQLSETLIRNENISIEPLAKLMASMFQIEDLRLELLLEHVYTIWSKYLVEFMNLGLPVSKRVKYIVPHSYGSSAMIVTTDNKPLMVIEYKEFLNGIDPDSYHLTDSLNGKFDSTLDRVFDYMMDSGVGYALLRDWRFTILIKLSVDKVLGNRGFFKDSKIVPYEFKIMLNTNNLMDTVEAISEAIENRMDEETVMKLATVYRSRRSIGTVMRNLT